jgi:integrase
VTYGLQVSNPLSIGAFYVHCLEEKKYASKTLGVVSAAIGKLFHLESSHPHRDLLVKAALKAAQVRAKQPISKKPLTLKQLEGLALHVKPLFESVRDFLMLLFMFAGMMRESEVVNLRTDQVWVEVLPGGASALFIFIWKSKTDTTERGHTVVLAEPKKAGLNAVRWFSLFAKFRALSHGSSPWLFCNTTTGAKLADTTPNHVIKRLLSEAGVPDVNSYGSHSCRRGGATTAAASGVEERLIKRHGNWRSDAVHLYITDSLASKLSVSRRMLDHQATQSS